MKAPALALLAASIASLAQPAAAGYHAICPYAQPLCAEYDSLKQTMESPDAGDPAPLQARLVSLSRRTQELVVEQTASGSLGDRPTLESVFADIATLRDRLESIKASKGLVAPDAAVLLSNEKAVDRLFSALPSREPLFLDQVSNLQAQVGRAGRSASGPSEARVSALRDALAMLVIAPGASVPDRNIGKESLLQTKSDPRSVDNPSSPTPQSDVANSSARAKGLKINEIPTDSSLSARIAALPYDPRVKAFLNIIAADADAPDAESTVGALERYKPKIVIPPADAEQEQGGFYDPLKNLIILRPGYLTPKEKANADPRLAPTGEVWPFKGMHIYFYADGHIRWEYSDQEMAGHLIHEVQHVRRHGEGGGANAFTNEMDSFNIQNRLFSRLQKKYGTNAHLSDVAMWSLETWQRSPEAFSARIIKDYERRGEIRPGEITIEEQEKAIRTHLASERSAPIRRVLEHELDVLERDRELSEEARRYNSRWRIDLGIDRVPVTP